MPFQLQEYTFEKTSLSISIIVTISLLGATLAASVFLLLLNVNAYGQLTTIANVIEEEDLELIPMFPYVISEDLEAIRLPYCDTPEGEASQSCHDRQDFDDITGLYPCNDGSREADWRDCPDAFSSILPI